ncbi:uncharacterized protein BX663DRAFT_522149 [Cokeromyces recurvatus]|uniref:uncharacterized protein n=1 Tax=Cokeromyces recurvatus TaxID=90255 RepID=UPI00221F34CD|nr:uncharacterized protein BX663DRAFT_522149 [Cokeromyces recurvatus]KAI7899308.1 hypothetical protein BX663DRAFT_522149 [Cokeromyces recurvatus]
MKLSSIINKQQSDSRLAAKLREKFGKDSELVVGDWSAANSKFHEPIRGKDMRRMLKKHSFLVYLIDEYSTSSFCLNCNDGKLGKLLQILKSRPFRRTTRPKVICHELLRCTNKKCLESNRQWWNRDLVAVLNFRDVMNSHRQALGRPSRFSRHILKRPSTSNDDSSKK